MKQKSDKAKVGVIGCGRWGTFMSWYANIVGCNVTLYGRNDSVNMKNLLLTRANRYITLDKDIELETDIKNVLKQEIIIISVNAQGLRELMSEIKQHEVSGKVFVLCMKGIEIDTGKRLTQIVKEYVDETNEVAIWVGPGHVEQFYAKNPNCMVIDCDKEEITKKLVDIFASNIIRIYLGGDLIGNEIGAAAKNVMGIAGGMLDGLDKSYLKGALMTRGCREISRLIGMIGGDENSAYGLSHLGDYEATLFSKFSHNREFGEFFVKGKRFENLAEGYFTVVALVQLGKKYNVELPICNAVYDVLYENSNPEITLEDLFCRNIRKEI